MKYKDLFIDFDDTLYDTHGNSMIALKKLFDERHWEKIMSSDGKLQQAYNRAKTHGTEKGSYSNFWKAIEKIELMNK